MARTPEEQKEANREYARKRKAKGLCCSCSRKAINGTRRCEVHTQTSSTEAATRYQGYKAAQICPLCKEPDKPIVEGKTCCQECLDKQAESTAARRPLNKDKHSQYLHDEYTKMKEAGLCAQCGDEPAIEGRIMGEKCAVKQQARAKKLANKRRLAVIIHYGAKCVCCSETVFEFLEIDHIDGGGNKHRKEIGRGKTYKWLIVNNYPPGFQVLCIDCNSAKGRYGICPHEQVRRQHAVTPFTEIAIAEIEAVDHRRARMIRDALSVLGVEL